MKLLRGHEAVAHVKGTLSEKHQVHAYAVDLTVKVIWGVEPTGRLDFGGGEYAPAGHNPVESHRIRAEDNYQWWELERGCYFIEFNETLELGENEIALIEPDPRTLRTGATHASRFLRGRVEPLETLFDVQATARDGETERARFAPAGFPSQRTAQIVSPQDKPKTPKRSR